jgi:tetratricopeptide (TPR) repeat protein
LKGLDQTSDYPIYPPYQLPLLPKAIVGRVQDCSNVIRLLENNRAVLVKSGLGGVGKTTLAALVAQQVRSEYPDGVLWAQVDLEDTASVADSFLASLQPNIPQYPASPLGPVAKARHCRSLFGERKCLVVLDNALRAEEVLQWLAPQGASRFLITSRYLLAAEIPDCVEYPLAPFSVANGVELFRQLSPMFSADEDSRALDELSGEIGGLPLAIRIATGVMTDLHWQPQKYLREFRASCNLNLLSVGDSVQVRTSFDLSYNTLTSDSTKRVFRLLGAFKEKTIERSIVSRIMIAQDASDLDLLVLFRRGLVGSLDSDSLTLHPLMHRYAAELLSAAGEGPKWHKAIGEDYRRRISIWNSKKQSFADWGRAQEQDAVLGMKAFTHFQEANLPDAAQAVLEAVADVITRRGSERWLLQSLSRLREVGLQLLPWLEIYWADLTIDASDDRNSGSHAAALEKLQTLSASQDKKIASAALICLARDERSNYDLPKARQFLERSLSLKREMQPPDRRGIAYVLNELGNIDLHINGDARGALNAHHEALQIQRELIDSQGVAYTLRRIASIELKYLHSPHTALEKLREAETLATQLNFTLVLVTVLIEKAEALRLMEYYLEAERTLKHAHQLAKDTDNPFTEAQVLHRMAILYEKSELYHEALLRSQESYVLFSQLRTGEKEDLKCVKDRLEMKVAALETELQSLEDKLQKQEKEGLSISEMRPLLRLRKRIRQKLGHEPGTIRLGKRDSQFV